MVFVFGECCLFPLRGYCFLNETANILGHSREGYRIFVSLVQIWAFHSHELFKGSPSFALSSLLGNLQLSTVPSFKVKDYYLNSFGVLFLFLVIP